MHKGSGMRDIHRRAWRWAAALTGALLASSFVPGVASAADRPRVDLDAAPLAAGALASRPNGGAAGGGFETASAERPIVASVGGGKSKLTYVRRGIGPWVAGEARAVPLREGELPTRYGEAENEP